MIKKIGIKTLSVLFLVFTLSTGSQQLRSFAIETNNLSSTVTQNNQNNSEQSAAESNPVQNANQGFTKLVDDFLNQLNSNKLSVKKRKNKLVNSANILSNLQELESLINILKFYLLTEETQNKLKNIKSNIDDIKLILKPIESGINEEAIVNIHNILEKKNPNDRKNFSDSSPDNDKIIIEIKNYLSEKSQEITKDIDQLKSISNSSSKVNKPRTPKTAQDATNKNFLNIVLFGTGIIIGIIAGSVGILLLLRHDISKVKQQLKSGNNKSPIVPEQVENNISQTAFNTEQVANAEQTTVSRQNVFPEILQHRVQPTDIPTPPSVINNPDTHYTFTSHEQTIATRYNQNPKQVCKNATEVSETTDSIQQRRLGANNSVILEKVSKGKGSYCIAPQQGCFYLLPKDNLKINQFNYETVNILFECYNYQPGRFTDFRLKTPAVVVRETEDTWRLQTKGELEFY